MRIKSLARQFLRVTFSYLTFAIVKLAAPRTKLLRGYYAGHIKRSDTIRIIAAGGSIERSCARLPESASDYAGINYFIECDHLEMWKGCSTFVIEPHKLADRYIRSARQAAAAKGGIHVVVKGFGSPQKLWPTVRFVRQLAAIPGLIPIMTVDAYISDTNGLAFAQAVERHYPTIISGAKTFQWALSFAFSMGYRNIVLQGFDFGKEYAYSKDSTPLPPNTWVNQQDVRSNAIQDVSDFVTLAASAGVKLYHAGCSGPLSEILPEWS